MSLRSRTVSDRDADEDSDAVHIADTNPLLASERVRDAPATTQARKSPKFPSHARPDFTQFRSTEPSTIHGILWFIGSIILYQFTDFPNQILNDARVKRTYLYAGLGCLGTNILIALYLVIWVRWIKKIKTDWDVYSPLSIPIATACGAAAIVLLSIAIWPLWGLFSPFLLFTLFMGFVSFLRVLPF